MSTDVVVHETSRSASDIRAQVNLIQEVMKAVMQKDQHFGVVPGCGNKPTLLKPGAEKLMMTFRLAVDPQVEDLSANGERRFRVITRVTSQTSAMFLGSGVGECSSDEEKYKWREAVCMAEYEAADATVKRIKYRRDGSTINQVRTNPADVANTILKMAKKRSLVDAVLTVTGASDIFTQDIEDMPEEIRNGDGGHRQAAPRQDFSPDTPYTGTLVDYIPPVEVPKGQKGNKPQRLTVDVDGAELVIGGFDLPDGLLAPIVGTWKGERVSVSYILAAGGKFKNLKSLSLVAPEPPPEPSGSPQDGLFQASEAMTPYLSTLRLCESHKEVSGVIREYQRDTALSSDEKAQLTKAANVKLEELEQGQG